MSSPASNNSLNNCNAIRNELRNVLECHEKFFKLLHFLNYVTFCLAKLPLSAYSNS